MAEEKTEGRELSVLFKREKETKNTVRFEEQPPKGKPPMVGTLYVQKWLAADHRSLILTIDFTD